MLSLLRPQLRKVERDKKTMDQEIVELTNKLLDAKNTVDHLEELNVRQTSFSLSHFNTFRVQTEHAQTGSG